MLLARRFQRRAVARTTPPAGPGGFALESQAGGRTSGGGERRLQLSARIFAQAPTGLSRNGCCHGDDCAVTQGYAGNGDRNDDQDAAMASQRVVSAEVLCAFQMRGFVEHPETEGVVHRLAVLVAQHHCERRRIENERSLRVEPDRRSFRRDDACRSIRREEGDAAGEQREGSSPAGCRISSPHVKSLREFARYSSAFRDCRNLLQEGYAAIAAWNGNTDLSPSGVMTSTPQVKLSASSGIEPGITM